MLDVERLMTLQKKYDERARTWNSQIERTFRRNLYPWYDNILSITLNEYTGGKKVKGYALDLGCGTGKSTENLFPYSKNVVAIDSSREMVKKAQKRFRKMDLEKRPDLILSSVTNLPFTIDIFYIVSARGSLINHLGKENTLKMLEDLYNSMLKESIFIFNFAEKTTEVVELPNFPLTFYETDEVKEMVKKVKYLPSILGNKPFKVKSNKHYFKNNSICIKAEKI